MRPSKFLAMLRPLHLPPKSASRPALPRAGAAAPGRARLCLALFAAFSGAFGSFAAEPRTTEHRVAGLQKNVEILVDRWGVPHIFAQAHYDAYFAQGFNAARDRLWQIDLWRKKGLGELAADFGPAFVDQDRASRLFLFRGDMHAEWLAYSSDAKRVVENFTAGVNAYIQLTRARPELLPPEFALLGYQPALWQPADIVRIRSHGLSRNLEWEVARAKTIALAGLEADAFRRPLEPAWQTRVPAGIDPASIPPDVLRDYLAARTAPQFTPEKLKSLAAPRRTGAREPAAADPLRYSESNNFVVAAARSTTGRPILANDPHRAHGVPSLRYFSHLSAPGLDVIGAGEPFLPGVSLGHNRTIAFGLTIFAIDQEDLYVYETNPAAPDEYRYRDRWEPMTRREESIAVRGAVPQKVTLKFTRHGPVIFEDLAARRAYAARVAWLEPGGVPYLSSLEYQRAADWDAFNAAMNRHGTPSLNYLYADTAGNTAWAPSGFAPVRPNWDGLLPVPGDGRFEWEGLRSMDQLPRVVNPAAGWFGTSNEMNLPDTPEAKALQLGFEWTDPARYQRQRQIFEAPRSFSVRDVIAAQTDITTVTGQRAIALLKTLPPPPEPELASALERLRTWDGRSARDSVGAALYNVWYHRHVRRALIKRVVPAAAAHIGAGSSAAVINYLEQPDARLGPDPVAARNELLLAALRETVAALTQTLGPDQKQWQWGRLHTARFEHPLAGVAPDALRAEWSVGPLPKAGDGETLGVSTWRESDFRLTAGASARFVADVGNWNNTWATNTPGQSGDPRSRHYRDLFADWANDIYFPLLFDRTEIEKVTDERIVLVASPAPRRP